MGSQRVRHDSVTNTYTKLLTQEIFNPNIFPTFLQKNFYMFSFAKIKTDRILLSGCVKCRFLSLLPIVLMLKYLTNGWYSGKIINIKSYKIRLFFLSTISTGMWKSKVCGLVDKIRHFFVENSIISIFHIGLRCGKTVYKLLI